MECTKKLSCGHVCDWICHNGACRPLSDCTQKVRLRCACGYRKVAFLCNEAPQSIACTESCEENKRTRESKRLEEEEASKREASSSSPSDSSIKDKRLKRKRKEKPEPVIIKPPHPFVVKVKEIFNTLTSEAFWKVVFVYSLSFLVIFSFMLLTSAEQKKPYLHLKEEHSCQEGDLPPVVKVVIVSSL